MNLAPIVLLAAHALAAPSSITPEMDKKLMEGIDAIYRMEFDKAEAAARQVIALNPEHPYGYLGVASAQWTRFVYETEQTDVSMVPKVEAQMLEVGDKAAAWLKKHPGDAAVLMVQGAAYGMTSRLLCMRHEWLRAYRYGRRAVKITKAAVEADPEFYDAYLGLGMYDYYTDIYPRTVGVLAKIMFGGNRKRGIETLKMVAEKGHYSKNAAKMLLVEIYNQDKFGAWDPQEALRILKEVRAEYPNSAMLHAAQLVSLYEAKRYQEVVSGAQTYLQRVKTGAYAPTEKAKGSVILATALWAEGEGAKAVEPFKEAAQVKVGSELSRWAVWALIRGGHLLDVLGRREEAVASYRQAASLPDHWGLRAIAKANLSKPFKAAEPGPIQSPD
jgi:tetratricopeptide (TPR) repeat protein